MLLLPVPGMANAQEVVAVMEGERLYFDRALAGFVAASREAASATSGIKNVQPVTLTRVVIGDRSDRAAAAEISSHRPALILALGERGLRTALAVEKVPILYLLVGAPDSLVGKRSNVTGIDLLLPAEPQLAALHRYLPGLKRLGVIYDHGRTGKLVDEARRQAGRIGIELLARPVGSDKQVPQELEALAGKIDGLWMVPDRTVVRAAMLPEIFLFSLRTGIPVITFAAKYLDFGAAMAITFDEEAMGAQAWAMAAVIFSGTPLSALPPRPAEKIAVKLNQTVLNKLGLRVAVPATETAP